MSSRVVFQIGFLIILLASLDGAAAATSYTVGDIGWTVPGNRSFYDDWANGKTFEAGDSLVFNWTTLHNVLEVTSKAEYDNCTKTNGIVKETSPATISLDANATRYFICTIDSHCSSGQKVTIKVGNGISPSNSAHSSLTITALSSLLSFTVFYILMSPAVIGLVVY